MRTGQRWRSAAWCAGVGAGVLGGAELLISASHVAFDHRPELLLGPIALIGFDLSTAAAGLVWLVALALFWACGAAVLAAFRRRTATAAIVSVTVPLLVLLTVIGVGITVIPQLLRGEPVWDEPPPSAFALLLVFPVIWLYGAWPGFVGAVGLVAAAGATMLAWRRLWLPTAPRRIPDEVIEDDLLSSP